MAQAIVAKNDERLVALVVQSKVPYILNLKLRFLHAGRFRTVVNVI